MIAMSHMDPTLLKRAFGSFPSGVTAVGAVVAGRARRHGCQLVHLCLH
jgi:hypothetical protein